MTSLFTYFALKYSVQPCTSIRIPLCLRPQTSLARDWTSTGYGNYIILPLVVSWKGDMELSMPCSYRAWEYSLGCHPRAKLVHICFVLSCLYIYKKNFRSSPRCSYFSFKLHSPFPLPATVSIRTVGRHELAPNIPGDAIANRWSVTWSVVKRFVRHVHTSYNTYFVR